MSESYVHALAQHIPKSRARALIEIAVQGVRETGTSLPEILLSMKEVTDILSASQIAELAQPENYLGMSAEIADNVLALARERR